MASSVDVLIIGAGAAGLTAAYDLHYDTGISYKILEASSGIGGRLQKLKDFADFPIDIGGEWIHVEPTILDVIYADPDENATDFIGTIPYLEMYDEYMGDGVWVTEEFNSTDYKFLNFTWFDFFNDYIAPDLVTSNLEVNCVVDTVDWTMDASVQVTCADGRNWTAKHVIVTASIKVLQDNDIAFSPELPEETQEAIDEYYFMPGLKVFMKFQNKFYREAFELASDYENVTVGTRYFYNAAYGQTTDDNVLGIFAVGDPAEMFLNWTDQEIYDDILEELDVLYDGQASTNFLEGFVQNWNNQMYVKGAYTYLTDDFEALQSVDTLREPISNRIFFAGEAVPADSYEYGFAHGAALSGRAAAEKVSQALSATETTTQDPVVEKSADSSPSSAVSLVCPEYWLLGSGIMVLFLAK